MSSSTQPYASGRQDESCSDSAIGAVVPTVEELRAVGLAEGLAAVGVASVEPFESTRVDLEQRKADGLAAQMQFTYRNPSRSTDPKKTMTDARALIVGAYDFSRHQVERPKGEIVGKVATYSSQDHYAALRLALEAIAEVLRRAGHKARVLADENNLVDRAVAHRAGIGWWGKSSNILVPGVGSLVVLGSVLTNAPMQIPKVKPMADGCKSCKKCLDGCPTGAIVAPGVVDANRCLAWLLQASGTFPIEYRKALGDRIYGCDDCQDVCPPNQVRLKALSPQSSNRNRIEASSPRPPNQLRPKAISARSESGPSESARCQHPFVGVSRGAAPSGNGLSESSRWVSILDMLELSDEELMRRFGRWYVPKRNPAYLRRNALVVLGNIGDGQDTRTSVVLSSMLRHDSPIVVAHAVWAAKQLGRTDLLQPLNKDLASGKEINEEVRVELERCDSVGLGPEPAAVSAPAPAHTFALTPTHKPAPKFVTNPSPKFNTDLLPGRV